MSGIEAYGNMTLSVSSGGTTPVWTVIGGIRTLNGTKTELSFNDSTTFDDSDGFRTFTPGLRDPGTCDIDLYFDPNAPTYDTLTDAHEANPPTKLTFKIELLTGSDMRTRTFDGYVASVGEKFEVDGFLESSISLRVTGPVVRS